MSPFQAYRIKLTFTYMKEVDCSIKQLAAALHFFVKDKSKNVFIILPGTSENDSIITAGVQMPIMSFVG